ncbi:TPA: alpha/beta hydrolase [Pseudomonas aeruginosa]|nr:alpha/beta hydrolase [Pseudomonas aeruginosa]
MAAIQTQEHWVTTDQGRLYAKAWIPGKASSAVRPPIVLLHDSLGCIELWREFPDALCHATGRQVIAYDRLGFGRSEVRAHLPSLDFVVEESRDFFPQVCEQLGVDSFVVLGHSVGGSMAIQCAADHADQCEALVTLAAQVFPEDRTLAGIRRAQEHFRAQEQMERLARYQGYKAQWVLDAWIKNWLHPDFSGWSLLDVLPRVRCPVLAIHGDKDEYGSRRHPELIGQYSSGVARVEILPGVGHVPQREQPQTVLELVSVLLR